MFYFTCKVTTVYIPNTVYIRNSADAVTWSMITDKFLNTAGIEKH